MRGYMRKREVLGETDDTVGASVGLTAGDLELMYRLLAIAKYEQRYVIPPAHAEEAGRLMGQHEQLFCSLDTEGGPGMGGAGPGSTGPHGIQAWRPAGAPGQDHTFRADDGRTHFNLLGWDGRGDAPGLFPERGTP
jgi:nitrate reductase beta subunit